MLFVLLIYLFLAYTVGMALFVMGEPQKFDYVLWALSPVTAFPALLIEWWLR